nr:membrane protein of ER body-like protein [Tanacetum cinerariifolium]
MVDEKMLQDGTLPDEGKKPWKKVLITSGSFLVFGSTPILAFIILIYFTRNDTHKFIGACIFFALTLVAFGIAKAKIAGQIYALSAGGTLLNGAIAGVLRDVAGLED